MDRIKFFEGGVNQPIYFGIQKKKIVKIGDGFVKPVSKIEMSEKYKEKQKENEKYLPKKRIDYHA